MSSVLFITVMKCRLKTLFPVVVVAFIAVAVHSPICSLRVIVELVVRIPSLCLAGYPAHYRYDIQQTKIQRRKY